MRDRAAKETRIGFRGGGFDPKPRPLVAWIFFAGVLALWQAGSSAGVIDSLFLPSPARIYHIEHAIGSGWTPEGQQRLIERTQSTGVRWLAFEDVLHCARFMNCYDAPMIFNHEDWGFAGEELRENPISPESTERLTEPHPVFAHFPIYSGVAEPGFAIDFLGAKTRHEFLSGAVASAGEVTTRHPPLDEEYFEWIDVLESVCLAQGRRRYHRVCGA